jgi:hypothetical protein
MNLVHSRDDKRFGLALLESDKGAVENKTRGVIRGCVAKGCSTTLKKNGLEPGVNGDAGSILMRCDMVLVSLRPFLQLPYGAEIAVKTTVRKKTLQIRQRWQK